MVTPDIEATLNPDEASSLINVHVEGDDRTLQLFEVKLSAHQAQRIHAHALDEIIYVVSGSMKVGNRTLLPGSSIFISGHTFYSFEAGPDGLHFLNFRPKKDMTFILPEGAR